MTKGRAMDRLLSMRVFQRVVDEGGFAAAARLLDLSASVVTRLVADLEAHLGTRLLQRSTRRLALTEAGQVYLSRVRHILQDIDEADTAASLQTQQLEGVLRVHAAPTLASHIVAPLMPGFRQLYPKIAVDLLVDGSPNPPIEDFDITLLATQVPFDAHVIARKVMESEAIFVASPAYLQQRGSPMAPQELMAHESMRLRFAEERSRTWRLWQQGDESTAVEVAVQPMLWVNHSDTLLRAALDGAGIISVALALVAPHLMRGELVHVLKGWVSGQMTVYAAMPSRKFLPQRTRVFLDYLVQRSRVAGVM
ncbi:LysR family transcriptional regulator [Paucibacter sp. TC2R-5]|uniref:LysR family transcriptional regulator n=1 Tax=Paucibacter sp. TC2R-5 TaxID=2893555 RepID=UPI0029623D00|nr:LysR family transcriptional regulator [Paucibacter sp. TC2R-5]